MHGGEQPLTRRRRVVRCKEATRAAEGLGSSRGEGNRAIEPRDATTPQAQPWLQLRPQPQVWTAGSIAYRCRDCQTTTDSAICITCFKDGGHEVTAPTPRPLRVAVAVAVWRVAFACTLGLTPC